MFKIYQNYLIIKFLKKFFVVSIIFFSLTIILGFLEEITFFNNLDVEFYYPYLLTLLNAPITLFEIFPFIILISTHFFFYDLLLKDELNILKKNGLSNFSIIKILFYLAIVIGVFNIIFFYNVSSNLKFKYSKIKNELSNDNKYLAMVIESGLWIKDESNDKIIIVKSSKIEKEYLLDVTINELDKDFKISKIIRSHKVNIKNDKWLLFKPEISINNINNKDIQEMEYQTNFNEQKIKSLFSNVSTYNLINLYNLKNDFEKVGYTTDEILIYILKIVTTPFLYSVLCILASIIVFNFLKKNYLLIHVIIGILVSILVYYMIFIFNSLGISGKLPISLSIVFPLLIIILISLIGLVNINEK